MCVPPRLAFFFFNDTATTEIYTLSLHDALPISEVRTDYEKIRVQHRDKKGPGPLHPIAEARRLGHKTQWERYVPDRKSTRLNSSHDQISYAVFCLKKKKGGLIELETS